MYVSGGGEGEGLRAVILISGLGGGGVNIFGMLEGDGWFLKSVDVLKKVFTVCVDGLAGLVSD